MRQSLITVSVFAVILGATPMFGITRLAAQVAQPVDGEQKTAIKRRPDVKPRRSEVLGKAAFQQIEKVDALVAEAQFTAALALLAKMQESDKYKAYEKAFALQKAGQVYFEQGDYRAAISRFEQAIKADVLSLRVVSGLRYNLAQLYLVEEKPDIALGLIKTWFDGQQKAPQAAAFALRARIYMALGRLAEAEQDIRLAVSKAAAKTDQPNQAWTRILLSILLQQERYDEARPMLEDAVQIWPGVKSFWQHLSSIYYMAGEEELGFAARQAMHVQGMLTQGSERASMAQLYLYHNVPIKAAALLKAGLDDGTIEANEKHYEMLAQAYMHSREWQKAIAPLTKAAELSDDGAHYQQLAQAYVQDEQWAEAEPVLVKALAKGGLKDEADNWLLLGIVQVRLEKYEAAIKAFRKAGDDDDIAKDAFRWIRNIERRLAAANSAG